MGLPSDTAPQQIAGGEPGVGGQSPTTTTGGAASAPAMGSVATAATPRSGSANPQAPLPPNQDGARSTGFTPAGQPSIPARQPATPEAGPRSPILMASVGTYSGPIGAVFEPILKGAQLWITAANANGGVNGHQVKLFVYDDGGDPARHRAQVQDAVEHRNVIGFFSNIDAIAGASSVGYINAKRIPVVGTDPAADLAYSSPMYFLQGSTGNELTRSFPLSIAQQVLPRGLKRLGTLICVEAEQCNTADRLVAETAREAGLDVVYRGRASLAQPDFTAECLSARKENVEVLFIGLDQNSVGRVTAACARQGYHPIYAPLVADAGQKDNPELAGAVALSPVFPYFQSGTPATDEFRAAVRNYGGGMVLSVSSAVGWAAGKLLQRAASAISEPPTTENLLAGLWSIKADTLGGLTSPRTFVKDQPPSRITCWFNLTIAQRAWVSPDGYRLNCR